jgi:uncharacterized protein YjlB
MIPHPLQIQTHDNGTFPNSKFPALLYKRVLDIPALFPATHVSNIFQKNNWGNSWDAGIFEYQHYHSTVHEVLGVYKGSTTILLGGDDGTEVKLEKGDVLIIPAGVAHKNLGNENDIGCVGAYPYDQPYDMNYGAAGERPLVDENLRRVPIPDSDPMRGKNGGVQDIWHD